MKPPKATSNKRESQEAGWWFHQLVVHSTEKEKMRADTVGSSAMSSVGISTQG